MPPVTRRATAAANETKGTNEPPKPLKIKLKLGQVKAAIKLAAAEKQKVAIEEAATLEAELRQARATELQEALQVTRSTALGQAPTMDAPPEQSAAEVVNEHGPYQTVRGEEERAEPKVGTPLVCQSNI